jgi:hypothetical protein
MWRIVVVCVSLLAAGTSSAQSVIRLARIADIPDQYVGGEMLRAVYAKLNIKLEFEDVPGKRALALSSAGEVDGEIQRIGTLSREYPTLLQVTPAINYIEPAVFATRLHFDVNGWNSIRNYSIGIVRGVGSSEAGTRGMDRVTATTSLENMIRMLDADRFDVMVTDLFSGLVAVRKLNLQARIYPLPAARAHPHLSLPARTPPRSRAEGWTGDRADGGERRAGGAARGPRQAGSERPLTTPAQKPKMASTDGRLPRRLSTIRSPPLSTELP